MEQLINHLQNTVSEAKVTYEKVSREKAETAKLREEEHRKAQEVAKEKRIRDVVGSLPKEIKEAAEKGFNQVDIPISDKDVVQHARTLEYSLAFKVGSGSYEAYEFLKGISGIIVKIYEDKKESTGAYGERECYSNFYIRVTF